MTLTFRVGISRSFETCIKIALSYLHSIYTPVTRFGTSFHSKETTKNDDMRRGSIYSKAVTFDLDLESQKKNWQEQFLKPTRETKHDGIYQLCFFKIYSW